MVETISYGSETCDGEDHFDEYFTFTNLFTFSRIAPPPFHARGQFWDLGSVVVTEHVMGPVHAYRGPSQHAIAPADHVTLMVMFDGSLNHEAETIATARSGDVLLFDYSRVFDYRSHGHAGATINLPRALIENRHGPLAGHGVLPASPQTRLFGDLVRSLIRELPMVETGNVPAVATLSTQMVLTVLADHAPPPAPGSVRSRAHAYVEQQPPGTLDAARMAAALGLSRSKLYRLFESDGGVYAYDRRRRLQLLHFALLEEPRSTPLGTLGARYGFLEGTSLARQFRAQFGYSMSEVRDHLGRHRFPTAAVAPLERFRRAFETLY